jgi:hypothetical protein
VLTTLATTARADSTNGTFAITITMEPGSAGAGL